MDHTSRIKPSRNRVAMDLLRSECCWSVGIDVEAWLYGKTAAATDGKDEENSTRASGNQLGCRIVPGVSEGISEHRKMLPPLVVMSEPQRTTLVAGFIRDEKSVPEL